MPTPALEELQVELDKTKKALELAQGQPQNGVEHNRMVSELSGLPEENALLGEENVQLKARLEARPPAPLNSPPAPTASEGDRAPLRDLTSLPPATQASPSPPSASSNSSGKLLELLTLLAAKSTDEKPTDALPHGMKVKLPDTLNGKTPDVDAWLKPAENYFDLCPPISDAKKRKIIGGLLSDAALAWWSKHEPTADDAGKLLTHLRSSRRANNSSRLSRLDMWKLRQTGGAKAHNDALNKIALRVEDLSADEQLPARLSGLDPRLGEKIADYIDSCESLAELQGKAIEKERRIRHGAPTPPAAGLNSMGRGGLLDNTNNGDATHSRVEPKRLGRLTDDLRQLLEREGRPFFCRCKGHTIQERRKRVEAQRRRGSGNGSRRS
eukprot:Plantae.Rhodophyta-Hildenbrandia_rubra.ctg2652.p1 GENE.Plantae.Rhodophyta-Hildenbrandia_rubra.ctg2652~~Plantae.Rhodophyta-Hildenbrandia_rubra.ctg2652.p1  ORF type:complete len:420 (-),score=28.72 Plantae.Rhodophyta-Hildenbrandia_rubra.ctg2652:770-1918(-)